MKIFFISVSIITLTTGCVNNFAAMPDRNLITDPVLYTEMYAVASEKGLVNPLAFIGGREDTDFYHKFKKSWCADNDKDHSDLYNDLSQICKSLGGTFTSQEWCADKKTDKPLFKTYLDIDWKCSTGVSMHAEVISPIQSKVGDNRWDKFAKEDGFKSKYELSALLESKIKQTEIKNQLIERKKLLAQERKHIDKERMLTTRGLRICNEGEYGQVYVGFVEDFTNTRIKVNVVSYGRDSRFRPSTVWDNPDRWYVCEQVI